MSQNNEITIPFSEYIHLIENALLLNELVKLGVQDWEHFKLAEYNVDEFLNSEEDGTQSES
jgi:hypothetical protein